MNLRWGILGVGRLSRQMVPIFRQASNATLVAIASRTYERAADVAREANIPLAFGSYDDLISEPSIDAVYVALPNSLHAEWTIRAAACKKHVLCEKPLAPTARDAESMVDACRREEVVLMESHMWRHHARTAHIRKMLDRKVLGDVSRVFASFTISPSSLAPNDIRLQPELGGGSLLDLGCYAVHGILWTFDADPTHVSATGRMQGGVDREGSGWLRFSGGGVGFFDCGFVSPYRTSLEIVGTAGTIKVREMWFPSQIPATFELYRPKRAVEEHALAARDQRVEMLETFARAIDRGDRPESARDAVRCLKVLDALAQSLRNGVVALSN